MMFSSSGLQTSFEADEEMLEQAIEAAKTADVDDEVPTQAVSFA